MTLLTPAPGYKVSPAIAVINVVLFLALAAVNLSLTEFSTQSVLNFGANFAPFVSDGQWWRLFTSMFLHLSIMHLLFNSVSLLFLGRLIEPLLGHIVFLLVYLSTGLAGSLASFWFNDDRVVSAGASGAIFGLFGVFIAFLLSGMVQKKQRDEWLKSVGGILAINLGMGLFLPVDNAAHLGGLISGTVLGFALLPLIRNRLRKMLAP